MKERMSCQFCSSAAVIQVKFFNKYLKCGCGQKTILDNIDVCSLDCLRRNGYKTTLMFDFLDIEFTCISCGSYLVNRVEGDITGL